MLRMQALPGRALIAVGKRGFYFNAVAVEDRNFPELEFPLNVGYNDHYQFYSQRMAYRSRLKLFIKKKPMQAQFLARYQDLLKAIKNQNYDTLDLLCEERLTKVIAAKVYELGHLQKYKFDVI